MKNKVRRKPTAKEMASAIIEINSKVNECYARTQELDNVLGLYIEMNKDIKKFNSYIEQKIKAKKEESNDQKTNGVPDKPNLQGDTDGEGSGSKRVRKKSG
jgi:hypothetical protein